MNDFMMKLYQSILKTYAEGAPYYFSPAELSEFNSLSDNKYKTWQWIYGYSPRYHFHRKFDFEKKSLYIEIEVEKGEIKKAGFTGDKPDFEVLDRFKQLIIGEKHDYFHLFEILNESDIKNNFPDLGELLLHIF